MRGGASPRPLRSVSASVEWVTEHLPSKDEDECSSQCPAESKFNTVTYGLGGLMGFESKLLKQTTLLYSMMGLWNKITSVEVVIVWVHFF